MSDFERAAIRLATEMKLVDITSDAYAIFGSASFVMRGILSREPKDIDVLVEKWVWARLFTRRHWSVLTPTVGDPPILMLPTTIPVHVFYDWRDNHVNIDVAKCISLAAPVFFVSRLFQCVRVSDGMDHKRQTIAGYPDHPKVPQHKDDLDQIERWLDGS